MLVFDPAESYDVRLTPRRTGELALTVGHPDIPGVPPFANAPVPVRVR